MKAVPCWLVATSVIFTCFLQTVFAQTYPSKPIRLIVPYPPGGGSDNAARPMAQKLSETLGKQVVVDNRGGGGTTIGTNMVAKAAPDGYTLLLCSIATHATSPQIVHNVPYDPFKDFEPITLIATSPILLVVHNKLAADNVKALIDLAKAHPGKLTYASGGTGSGSHLEPEIFKAMAGIDVLHVPYKGGSEAMTDMIAGRVDIQFTSAVSVMPHVRSARLKAIAISRESRWPDLPYVQTFAEAGWPQYQSSTWYGLCAPARTPAARVDRLNREARKALASADYRERLRMQVADPVGNSPQEFGAFIRMQYDKYGKVIRALGVRVD